MYIYAYFYIIGHDYAGCAIKIPTCWIIFFIWKWWFVCLTPGNSLHWNRRLVGGLGGFDSAQFEEMLPMSKANESHLQIIKNTIAQVEPSTRNTEEATDFIGNIHFLPSYITG